MTTIPTMPTPGTDPARLLEYMMASYPHPAWNVNRELGIVGNSRASDLRDLGWNIESERGDRIAGTRKYKWGYRIVTPRDLWPTPHPTTDTGQTFLEVVA